MSLASDVTSPGASPPPSVSASSGMGVAACEYRRGGGGSGPVTRETGHTHNNTTGNIGREGMGQDLGIQEGRGGSGPVNTGGEGRGGLGMHTVTISFLQCR